MKPLVRRALFGAAITVLTAAGALAAATPASAAEPAPSSSGGVVTICPGTEVSLDDQDTGAPLALGEQQALIDHFELRCAHPTTASQGAISTTSGGRTVSPNKSVAIGDVTAHLTITPGNVVWSTTASSLPSGTKKLNCTSRVNGGTWHDCGEATGTGSSLSTRTNQTCPPKGQKWEVEAFLRYGSADYWDVASGVTK
jgi:hypothetical protein